MPAKAKGLDIQSKKLSAEKLVQHSLELNPGHYSMLHSWWQKLMNLCKLKFKCLIRQALQFNHENSG